MKKLLIGALVAVVSLPAFAWGAREQGLLTGLVVGSIINHNHKVSPSEVQVHHYRHGFSHYNPPVRYYYPSTVYQAPIYSYVQPVQVQPQVVVVNSCKRVPVLDENNQIIAFTQVCNNKPALSDQ